MVHAGIVHPLKAARMALIWAAIAVPGAALPEEVPDSLESASHREQLIERIAETQSRLGQASAQLIEPLTELALFHEAAENHASVVVTVESARHVVRVNYGLHSLEEVPLLRILLRSRDALGDAEGAWALEQQLLSLAERHQGHPSTLPIYRDIADRRLDVLERYAGGEFPPELFLGCYYSTGRNPAQSCRSGNRIDAVTRLLQDTLSHYSAATDLMVDLDLYSGEALWEVETSVVRALHAYLTGNHGRPTMLSNAVMADIRESWSCPGCSAYGIGNSRLRRIVEEAAHGEATVSQQIQALIQLADWRLEFWRGRRRDSPPALETYAHVYAQLIEHDVAEATIDAVFSPPTPVVLPAFLPNPLATVRTPESTGWIDVAFDITSHGKAEDVTILDTTRATQAQRRELADLIRRSRFRPRVVDGELAEVAPVVLRYHVTD